MKTLFFIASVQRIEFDARLLQKESEMQIYKNTHLLG